jgi:hypothetical protein
MLIVCIAGVYAVLIWAGERTKVLKISLALLAVMSIAYAGAVAIGGDAIDRRISTLTDTAPDDAYHNNRQYFLTQTLTKFAPEYPLGAGLGRWGMMNQYFGDDSEASRGRIWVEIQWTGWLLDGGIPLVLAYTATLFCAIWTAWKIARRSSEGTLWIWGAIVLAYDVGALAMTFDYPFFLSQSAMDLWLLNAALFSAVSHIRVRVVREFSVPMNAARVQRAVTHVSA